jgi:hypothetical protein
MNNVTGLILTAIIATIGIIKFKLIEELVKKITPDNQKAKGYAIILLVITIVVLTAVSLSLDQPSPDDTITQTEPIAEQPTATPSKGDLEVKIDAVKDGITITEDLIQQAKENKRIKDSTFIAERPQRWVYQIGDWINDDDKILDMHEQLLAIENIKIFRQRKNYLFIKEDNRSREDMEIELAQLQADIQGLSVKVIDLNQFLTRRKSDLVAHIETFGKRKNKIKIECLMVD